MAGPFVGFAVGCDDGGRFLLPYNKHFVEVGGFGGVQRMQKEAVENQQVCVGLAAHFGLNAVVEPGGFEPLELNIGVAPTQIAVDLRTSLDTIRWRWQETDDWSPRVLGIAAHAECGPAVAIGERVNSDRHGC